MSGIPLVRGMRYALGVNMTDQQAMLLRQQMQAGSPCVYPRGRAPFQPEPPSDHTHVITFTETQGGELDYGGWLGPSAPSGWRWILPFPTSRETQCATGALYPAGVNVGGYGLAPSSSSAPASSSSSSAMGLAVGAELLGNVALGAIFGAGAGLLVNRSRAGAALGGLAGGAVGAGGAWFLGAGLAGALAGWLGGKVERAR